MTGMLLPNRIGPTQVTYRPARDILTKTSGFIKAYDYTLNPYSGKEMPRNPQINITR